MPELKDIYERKEDTSGNVSTLLRGLAVAFAQRSLPLLILDHHL
jgi:hypothetical protein